jgi:FtsP/CotA-like multicopper oxidase with cupredoxin domain
MRNRASRRIPQFVALLTAGSLAAAAAAAAYLPGGSGGAAPAATAAAAPNDPVIDLCATTGTVTLPGSVSVPVWGFVNKGTAADCSDVADTATLPGPPLTVDESATDVVTLNVTNALPAGHTISLEAPGINFDPGPTDAAVGDTVSRTFHPTAPGTYLYQSVGDAERQTAMGLYGALIVRPTAPGQAYDTASSAFDRAATLVLSDIDPAFNADPDGFDLLGYNASYWLINGKAYPQTDPIQAAAGEKLLLRYVNAGHDNTTMMLLGMHERVLARDGNLLGNPFDADAETIPAGGTEDAIATVPAGSSALPNGFPLYNRQLHVGNGAPADPTSPGGMLTFIKSP